MNILTLTVEERIVRNWTAANLATALRFTTTGHPKAPTFTPAMKRAVRAEVARRIENGDS